MQNFVTQLWNSYRTVTKDVDGLDTDSIAKTKKKLDHVNKVMAELKIFIYGYRFRSVEEEILWHKQYIPQWLAEYIFLLDFLKVEVAKSQLGKHNFLCFLRNKYKVIRQFLHKEQFMYSYLLSGENYLDATYFATNSSSIYYLHWEETMPIIDQSVYRFMSYKFARLLAYKKLESIIEYEMSLPQSPKTIGQTEEHSANSNLNWTDTGMSLTEIAYALKYSGAVNNGNVEVKAIADALSKTFNTPAVNVYRNKQDLYSRKNPGVFLDRLRKDLVRGMEDSDDR